MGRPESADNNGSARDEDGKEVDLPKGWMYKQRNVGPVALPWYASPMTQLLLVSFVCFFCPGMFNALSGLGGAGISDAHAANQAGTALNVTFSVVGFFGGVIVNLVGVRIALSFGGIGYFVYAAAALTWKHTQNNGFFIFAGVLLGTCAGVLWTAQGLIMMSYPREKEKGSYVAIFWAIFNSGAVIGSLGALGQEIHDSGQTASDGTYAIFMALMFTGAILACFLCDPAKVIRSDGTRVTVPKHPSVLSEFKGMARSLITDWYIIFLFPMYWSSNWFYVYHFNDFNLGRFNIRTRALNNVLYWTSQIVGALVFGNALDWSRFPRVTRARCGVIALFCITMGIWGGGFVYQQQFTRETKELLDWTSDGYLPPMFLYMFYGFFDAAWQTTVYWLIGSLTNNSRKTAYFAGFYKGIQSAGAAVVPQLDNIPLSYMSMLAINWGLLAGSLLLAAPVFFAKVKNHIDAEEDVVDPEEVNDLQEAIDVTPKPSQTVDFPMLAQSTTTIEMNQPVE
ncbi:DUF895 domain membrane protein [Planoprotostelium fungivorum]|uniref:DUF895 domain membrane protein n=1 Tax=Planoprotostelium fungivorum TaxID=1890364 RepID=A0A2P6NSZ6_9EUKA|nr:DUF895 domain membrane protein [Planoprotostelium fungivorum]